jgi:MYXO-CTERM domain-containing protein
MRSSFGVALALCLLAAPAHADRPITMTVPYQGTPSSQPYLISHIVYLNRCSGGCVIKPGTTDSRAQTSDILQSPANLSAYGGDWTGLMNCVKGVMAPFNITVTDVDPGASTDHFEVVIGGSPQQAGLPGNVGGIADYPCGSGSCAPGTYVQNAVVFDFSAVWGNDVLYTCGTAAQEVAHAWTLDHATGTHDPMTYNGYQSPLAYTNGAVCGSDCGQYPGCTGTTNAFCVPCSGNTHNCMETGVGTQNEVDIITNLFGPAGAAAPTVKFTAPTNGSAVQSGMAFPITVQCDTSDGVMEIDLEIDGIPQSTLTSSPAMFMGPSNLKDGTHALNAACGTNKKASAQAAISIVVGNKCSQDSDCMTNDICYQGACIPGPNAAGGLGATCVGNADCQSGECANDGTNHYCVVPCDPSMDHCPNGFGCLAVGNAGVCWKGASHGGGGICSAGGDGAGWLLVALSAMLVTGRRRKNP